MKRIIIFRIAYIRHENGAWKFYPGADCPPLSFKNSLIKRESLPAVKPSCKLYLEVKDNLIVHIRLEYYTLWELQKKEDRSNAPILPEAYQVTGIKCVKNKHHDAECCTCCPWCQYNTPAGCFRVEYPSECYTFKPTAVHK